MNCYLCKDSGHGEQPAHRDLGNGKGVCRFHYEGSMMPAETPAMVIPAVTPAKVGAGIQKETAMPVGRNIDRDKIRELHAQGLSDREIAEKLGCSATNVTYHRHKFGLPAIGRRGPRKSKGNGTVGDAMARISRRSRAVALAKAGAHVDSRLRGNDKNGSGTYTKMIEDLTAQRDRIQAAIDALAEL
jgi:hypothetical protein